MSNVLRTATLRERVPHELARDSLVEFLSLPIERVGGARLALEGYDLAQEFNCAAYDGLYLALATRLSIPFVHADDRLSQSLTGRFAHEFHVRSYR
jgi:predicted nucleic acid-binding protein